MILTDTVKEESHQHFAYSLKIGLMGPFGFGNLGDAAIQEAMIQNIYKYCPDAKIYGFSLNPEDTEVRHGIPSFPMGQMARNWWEGDRQNLLIMNLCKIVYKLRAIPNPVLRKLGRIFLRIYLEIFLEFLAWLRAFKQLKNLDLFIVSGGGQLDDYWGGAWQNPYALFTWSILAKLAKTKFIIASVGAGPIDAKLSKFFFKSSLALADYRSYRDEDSKQYIERVLKFRKNDPVCPDLAYSLAIKKYQNSHTNKNHLPIVGIGPMSYFDPRVWPERDTTVYLGYLTKLALFVSWLIEERYGILFFTGEAIHDRPVIKDLRDILDKNGVVYAEGQIIEEPIESVDDLMSELAKTDIVISARFHATLLPQLLNKPVLAISHHRKVEMLMADTGQSDYCVSIDTFDVDTLKAKFLLLEKNQDLVKQQLAQRIQQYKAALDKQYEHLFKNL
jgi:polysaccharide pyruvyl transferase WcaK-like protein